MSSSIQEPDGSETEEPGKKDALDEWVDELDRLIGIEPMSEEEIAEQQRLEQQKKKTGVDPALLIAAVIVILAVVALLFYLKIF